jgi:hypothetical protein
MLGILPVMGGRQVVPPAFVYAGVAEAVQDRTALVDSFVSCSSPVNNTVAGKCC